MSYKNHLEHIFKTNLDIGYHDDQILIYLENIKKAKTLRFDGVLMSFMTQIFNFENRMYFGESIEVVEMTILKKPKELLVKKLIATHKIEDINYATRSIQKLMNILDSCQLISTNMINFQSILEIHKQMMKGLAPETECGYFRTINVKASGFNTMYELHGSIRRKLSILIETTNEFVDQSKDNVFHMIIIASVFLVNFLKIHPFRNGNGRSGRILFSNLLKNVMPVPISLHNHIGKSYETTRNEYFFALILAQTGCALDYKLFIEHVFSSLRAYFYELYTIWVL